MIVEIPDVMEVKTTYLHDLVFLDVEEYFPDVRNIFAEVREYIKNVRIMSR